MTEDSNFKDLRSILDSILHKPQGKGRPEYCNIWNVWNEVVGPHIATRAQPETVRNGILFVSVESSVWMQELGFMKGAILERLLNRLGSPVIHDIRFKLATILRSTDIDKTAPLPELDREETERIEREIAGITDPDLRDSLRSLFAINVQSKKGKLRKF
jgi:hypothetical protein